MWKGWGRVAEQKEDGRGAVDAEALAFPGGRFPPLVLCKCIL